MKKSVLIGIIAVVLAAVAVVTFVVISPKNNCKHDDPTKIVVVKGKEATCQETGLTEGKKCTVCNTMVVPQTVQTTGCSISDWIVDLEATKTENGKRHKECTMCGEVFTEEVIAAGSQGLTYLKDGDNAYLVWGMGNCTDTDVVIPCEYNGLPVTSFGDYAFSNCTSLTSIVIPDSVTSISENAFSGCTSLTSVVIPDSVTSIGYGAFSHCSSLTSIEIPDSVTSIGAKTFYKCTSLTSVEVGDSVTRIGDSVFYGCTSLTSIVIPNSVTSIGEDAFRNCKSLTTIVIPKSVTSFGSYAFEYCTSLTIYCEAESKPSGWNSAWSSPLMGPTIPVVWGYEGN